MNPLRRVTDHRPPTSRLWRRQATRDFERVRRAPLSDVGASGKPLVLLVHGIGMSHRYFDRLASDLSPDHRVFAVDLPGFGGTARPSRPWSVEDYASHLIGELDRLGARNVSLVGHSMGAQFAVEVARLRPDAVGRLVLIGPVVESGRRTLWWQASALLLDSLREPPATGARVFADYVRTGIRWYLTELQAMFAYPIEQRMSELRVPVLVIRGARDPVSRSAWCLHLAHLTPNGVVLQIGGQPHVVQRSAAPTVGAAIRSFVQRTTNGA